jgi:TRAP transporter 4TM/12TM fusion protein
MNLRRLRGRAIDLLGIAIALYGLANVMPAIGEFRLGPFPMDWFRPTFFAMCMAAVGLTIDQRKGGASMLAWFASAASMLVLVWASWTYYAVSVAIDDAMFLFGPQEAVTAVLASAAVLFFCWRIWGGAVASLGIVGIAYLIGGPYLPSPLNTLPGDLNELLSQNLWYSLDTGILGGTFSIVITTVFPFIILGAILEGVGAGESMIRIAFRLMRRTAGGPAHAAILSSALFGTVSGSAVANVVGTGVVTIPMIKRRGFSSEFAGAVEAAASTGGQIMPPIMGAAALIMADYAGVSYLTIMLAVLLPAIAYYLSLFLMVAFETRKLGINPTPDSAGVGDPTSQDYINLFLIFGPLALIVALMITGYSSTGASLAAIALLFPLSFINADVRERPVRLLHALRDGGITFAGLTMAIAAVGIVISTLAATGVPVKFGILMNSALGTSLFVALVVVALGCILLGMGMPTLPAYVTVAAITVPAMQSLGLEPLTAHMFVFMIAVASTITPPVAIAAYAAAAISGGKPIGTGLVASRIGCMIFLIPFTFAYNPLILAVKESGAIFAWGPYLLMLIELLLAMYLTASALTRFDRRQLSWAEVMLRLIASVMLLSVHTPSEMFGFGLAFALLIWQFRYSRFLSRLTGA